MLTYCGNVPFNINYKPAKKQEKNNVKLIPVNPSYYAKK